LKLDDLLHHRLVHYDAQLGGSAAAWEWFDGAQTHYAPVGSMLTVNGTASYKAACLAGLGIIQVPGAGLRELIETGRLVEVLPDYRPAPMPVAFVYPTRRHVPARAVAFMDWVAGLLKPYLD
jgi:DNA-binding transcriptional LysR family regulator